jgi:hypothetical protein
MQEEDPVQSPLMIKDDCRDALTFGDPDLWEQLKENSITLRLNGHPAYGYVGAGRTISAHADTTAKIKGRSPRAKSAQMVGKTAINTNNQGAASI